MTTATKNTAALTIKNRCVRIDGRTYDLAYSKDAAAFLESGNFDHVKFPEGLNVKTAITNAADAADADSLTRTADDVMELVDAICAMGT